MNHSKNVYAVKALFRMSLVDNSIKKAIENITSNSEFVELGKKNGLIFEEKDVEEFLDFWEEHSNEKLSWKKEELERDAEEIKTLDDILSQISGEKTDVNIKAALKYLNFGPKDQASH